MRSFTLRATGKIRTGGSQVTVILAFAILISMLSGMVLGTGNLYLILALSAILVLPVLLFFPRLLFWVVLFSGLVLSGLLIMYLPGLRSVRWLVPVASFLMLISLIFSRMFDGKTVETYPPSYKPFFWSAVFFVVSGIIAVIANWKGLSAAIFGAKNYFQVVTLFFSMALLPWSEGLMKRFVIFLLAVACIQLPFALHQYLFIAPMREYIGHGIIPQDIVAGTFGGNVEGGGSNAALSAFLFVALSLLLAMWKNQVLSGIRLLFLLPVVMAPIFMNETKISVIYMILVFFVIFFRQITAQPGKLVVGMALFMTGLYAILYAYAVMHPSPMASTPLDLVMWTVFSNTSESVGYGALQLNRWTSFLFWFEQHGFHNLAQTIFGHGLSASKEAAGALELTTTLAMTKYPGMGIGLTSISSLLWDVGLMGLVSVSLLFFVAFHYAGRLIQAHYDDLFNRSVFEALRASVVVLYLSLAHKNTFVFDLPFQTIVWVMLGFILYSSRSLLKRTAVPSRASQSVSPAVRLIKLSR